MKAPFTALLSLGALLLASPVSLDAQDKPAKDATASGAIPAANNFAFDLFRQIATEPGDCVIAPDGIRQAFDLVGAGAQGETRAELDKVLGFSSDAGQHAKALLEVQSVFATNRAFGKIELRSDNALWLATKFPVNSEFRLAARNTYRAFVAPTDFSDGKDAANQINRWIASKTGGQPVDFIQPASLSKDTALILTNVSKYKLDWAEAFDPAKNLKHPFNCADGSKAPVEFLLNGKLRAWYAENNMFQSVAVPHAGNKLEMVVILPREKVALSEVIAKLTGDVFTQVRTAPMKFQGRTVEQYEVSFAMPKFQFNRETELVPVLKKMGVQKLFNSGESDLGGISEVKPLWVGQAFQRMEIEVAEQGAAPAAIATKADSPLANDPKPGKAAFGANRPFMFVIREKESGLIVCLGKIENAKGMTPVKE